MAALSGRRARRVRRPRNGLTVSRMSDFWSVLSQYRGHAMIRRGTIQGRLVAGLAVAASLGTMSTGCASSGQQNTSSAKAAVALVEVNTEFSFATEMRLGYEAGVKQV